ncbi:site-specific integrase [Congregibacter litoralis]|uniref:site-specific integrase n=1 Tax=Congregibacter litoralis TaxID=393662 RepID=UPI000324009A|nr:site-specific integrase [Congregibacter litoralis]
MSRDTAQSYQNHLFRFLRYVENNHLSGEQGFPCVHNAHEIQASKVREYVNRVLPGELASSSLHAHAAALKAYFTFIDRVGIRESFAIEVERRARQAAASNEDSQHYLQYVARDHRTILLQKCSSLRDVLILRMGFEVGLRARENCGLFLEGSKRSRKDSLLRVFSELDDSNFSGVNQFEYLLRAKTKGGKSRLIYFSRSLVTAMRAYYLGERQTVAKNSNVYPEPDEFFLNNDSRFAGHPISDRLASDRFSTYKKLVPHLDPLLGYHDLRHTFATELYHQSLLDRHGNETRSQSAALLIVAQRLGHALGRDGRPGEVTTRYIRLKDAMLAIEDID